MIPVAIIGAGIAGLACAQRRLLKGYNLCFLTSGAASAGGF